MLVLKYINQKYNELRAFRVRCVRACGTFLLCRSSYIDVLGLTFDITSAEKSIVVLGKH